MKPWKLDIRASATDSSSLEIVVYDVIGEDMWTGGGVTAQAVLEKLNSSPNAKKISMRINSVGGVMDDAKAIVNLLNERAANGVEIEAKIDGLAASAAAYLTTAATRVEMPENAFMMIHRARAGMRGNSDDLAAASKALSDTDDVMTEAFAKASARRGKAKTKADYAQAIAKADRYIRASEAIEWGLADSLTPSLRAVACAVSLDELGDDVPAELSSAPYVIKAQSAAAGAETTEQTVRQGGGGGGGGARVGQIVNIKLDATPIVESAQAATAAVEQLTQAIASISGATESEPETPEIKPMTETVQVTPSIARALGLPAGSSETDCVAAATRLRELELQSMAITGVQVSAEALGAVRGIKAKADRCDAVEAKLREVEAERDQQNFDALIMRGKSAPVKLTPATAKLYTDRFDEAKKEGRGAAIVADLKGYLEVAPTVIAERVAQPSSGGAITSANPTYHGKTYGEMTFAARARLSKDEPELYRAMKSAHEEQARV